MGAFALRPNTLFADDFRIVRPLTEGGMGAIYVAEQRSTHELRALKVMNRSLLPDERQRQRFEQEARITAHIPSDHVVKVVASGIDRETGLPWLAMELLEGQTLAAHCEMRGHLPPRELRDIFRQLCHALGAAHRSGIVHRDVKPENVFLARARLVGATSVVKVLDFGIAKMIQEQGPSTVTAAVGTPMWMAPEQMRERLSIGAEADVWALGLVAFAMLTGRDFWLAADGGTMPELLSEISIEAIPPASTRAHALGVGHLWPPALDPWFARCVARDPKARFRDADSAFVAFDETLARSSTMIATVDIGIAPTVRTSTPHLPMHLPAHLAVNRSTIIGATRTVIAPPPFPERRRSGKLFGALLASALVLGFAGASIHRLQATESAAPTCATDARACVPDAKALRKGSAEDRRAATALFERACDAGSSEACRFAGEAHEDGLVGAAAKSEALASKAYAKACAANDTSACTSLARVVVLSPTSAVPAREQAIASLQDACDRRSAMACGDLGVLYANGLGGVPVDAKRAEQLLGKAREGLAASCKDDDAPRACERLGEAKGTGPEAEAAFGRACEAGLPRACSALGILQKDTSPKEARTHLFDACALGQAKACAVLGHMLALGIGGDKDPKQGATRLGEACTAKIWEACDELAQLETDKKRAVELLDGACKAGHGPACTRYAMMLGEGLGVAKDMPRALDLLETSCTSRSEPDACAVLARYFWRGVKPADLFRAAARAEQGCNASSARACHVFGELMERHPAIGREDAAKTKHLKACDLGHAPGCTAAAKMTEAGRGGARSLDDAKKLYDRGCKGGHDEACALQQSMASNGSGTPRASILPKSGPEDCSLWGDCAPRKVRNASVNGPGRMSVCICAKGDPMCPCFDAQGNPIGANGTPPPPPSAQKQAEDQEALDVLKRLNDDTAWQR